MASARIRRVPSPPRRLIKCDVTLRARRENSPRTPGKEWQIQYGGARTITAT